MQLTWYGHSCFELKTDAGRTILFDPYNDAVGYAVPEWKADIVLLSHRHFDHANVAAVKSDCSVLRESGRFVFEDIKITGLTAFHDDQNGTVKGKNIIYIVEADGIRVCHCGDLGHTLDGKMLSEIGRVDYLLLPVGGLYTIDGARAAQVTGSMRPATVIPMHFKTDVCKIGIEGIDPFMKSIVGKSIEHAGCTVELGGSPEVLIMEYVGQAR